MMMQQQFDDSDFEVEAAATAETADKVEATPNVKSLEARRLIEQRMELKRLRELLDDPFSSDPLEV